MRILREWNFCHATYIVFYLILLGVVVDAFIVKLSWLNERRTFRCYNSDSSSHEWMNRPHEKVLSIPDANNFNTDVPLFDALYNSESADEIDSSSHSISDMTVREISDAYQFSLPFLGDFIIQLGCQPPLDIEVKVSNLLTGDQIFSLLNALNTLDAYESNAGYDSMSLKELADELNVSKAKILRISEMEGLNLPFGMETILHVSLVNKIRDGVMYDEYEEEDGFKTIPSDFINIEANNGSVKDLLHHDEETNEMPPGYSSLQ